MILFFPPTYIFSFLTVPEFLIITLSSDLQKDVGLTRRNSSENPTRGPHTSWSRQPPSLVGSGAWKKGALANLCHLLPCLCAHDTTEHGQALRGIAPRHQWTLLQPWEARTGVGCLAHSSPFSFLPLRQNGHNDGNTAMLLLTSRAP